MSKIITRGKIVIDQRRLKIAVDKSPWDLADTVLYELCAKYPHHKRDNEILAKVLLIGRSYAAAIERRKNSEQGADQFYREVVAPKIRDSDIDAWLADIAEYQKPTSESFPKIIVVHKKLTDLFREISQLEKRSLASKYLHFHFPNLFYIFDSRAYRALADITRGTKMKLPALAIYDNAYARFFLRCMALRDEIANQHKEVGELTPRQIDNYLLAL